MSASVNRGRTEIYKDCSNLKLIIHINIDHSIILYIPRHPLNKAISEMIESYCTLHVLVLFIIIIMYQEHDLIMICHVVIRYGYRGRATNGVNQAITI